MIRLFQRQRFQVEFDRNVAIDRRQLFRLQNLAAVVAQRFTVGLFLDLFPTVERGFDRADSISLAFLSVYTRK